MAKKIQRVVKLNLLSKFLLNSTKNSAKIITDFVLQNRSLLY